MIVRTAWAGRTDIPPCCRAPLLPTPLTSLWVSSMVDWVPRGSARSESTEELQCWGPGFVRERDLSPGLGLSQPRL